MKKLYSLPVFIFVLLLSNNLLSQNKRNGISYQALIVNTNIEQLPGVDNQNVPLVNTEICLSFSILDENGVIEYQEYVRTSTDELGMVNEIIGNGEQLGLNSWDEIFWSSSPKSLKVDLDIDGNCNQFENISNEPLTSVPFALFSNKSDVPGPPGKSAYEVWIDDGNQGDEEAFFDSLRGDSGKSAYDEWISLGNEGTEEDFINSLKGAQGPQGPEGEGWSPDLPTGGAQGDVLNWIWDGTNWINEISSRETNDIKIIGNVSSINQIVCELTEIEKIIYLLTGSSTNVSVNGLPGGVISRISNDTLYIEGTPDLDVNQTTQFQYSIQSIDDSSEVRGSITLNPSSSVSLTSGDINQNACLEKKISDVTFSVTGATPNVSVLGLPEGLKSTLSGNILKISGTPDSSIVNGSSYNYTIQSFSNACDPVTLNGSFTFSDCSSCNPNVFAGNDAALCFGDSFSPSSSASNYSSLVWSSSGSGSFNNPNSPTPEYLPSIADQNAGSVVLTARAENNNCTVSQTLTSSVTISIIDCSSINVSVQNQNICTVYDNSFTFGASIITPNIGAIVAAGICYNTTGAPTINDTSSRIVNNNTGGWAQNTASFESTMNNIPLNTPIYIRAYCETINGDIVYGEQIDILSSNPNLNHIFNFTSSSGSFNIDSYPVSILSEITFKNIENMYSFQWTSSNILSRNYKRANFPKLETINGSFNLENEFSIETIFAPELSKINSHLRIKNTSLEKLIFPKLIESLYIEIYKNNQMDSLNLDKYKKTLGQYESYGIIIRETGLKNVIMPSLRQSQFVSFYNNEDLLKINLSALVSTTNYFEAQSNPYLKDIILTSFFNTGDSGSENSSFSIGSNQRLENIEVPNLRKVYDRIYIYNNPELDVSQEFPCQLYVLENDSFDCSPDTVTVVNNKNNLYCFQDLDLRGDPTLVTTQPAYNNSTNQWVTGVEITTGANSFVKFEKRGVVYSTSPNPVFDNNPSTDPYFEEKGIGVASEDISIFRNLNSGTKYYVRSFVTDCNGSYYGDQKEFTTN